MALTRTATAWTDKWATTVNKEYRSDPIWIEREAP
jgi:hypothetical protein